MSHCDPRVHRRAAKMKDLARASVSGTSRYRSSKNVQQSRSRTRRAKLESITYFPAGLVCSGADECECAFCEYDDTASIVVKGYEHQWWRTSARDHNNPGYRMAEKKLLEFEGEFDRWYSWLKHNMPDTLAGRHLLDHIVGWVWCHCMIDSKHNYKGCTCNDPHLWRKEALGNYWMPRPDEPNADEATAKLREFRFDISRWDQWLDDVFAAGESGQSRRKALRKAIWCDFAGQLKDGCRCFICEHRWYRTTGWKTFVLIRDFLVSVGVDKHEVPGLYEQIKKWMGFLGVDDLGVHRSGEYLFDVEDPNFVRVYSTHIECYWQFDGARYEPKGALRWRVDLNESKEEQFFVDL